MKQDESRTVHLVNPLWDACGGADLRTLATFALLKRETPTQIWSTSVPAPSLARNAPIRRIRPWLGHWPRGGTLVLMGVYFRLGHWLRFAWPDRIVILYNTHQPDRLERALQRCAWSGCEDISVVYTSEALRDNSPYPGVVLESPVNIEPYMTLPRAPRSRLRPLVMGRLSRDTLKKHHPEDVALYQRLAAAGVRVRLMGATCLAPMLAGIPNIELLPAGAESPSQFLASLDCFYYRTSDGWYEAFGRVIFEAMAAGLPVVACQRGGYAGYLSHGEDALLFSSTDEAEQHIRVIAAEPELAAALGASARNTAITLMGPDLAKRTYQALGPRPPRMKARKGIAALHDVIGRMLPRTGLSR